MPVFIPSGATKVKFENLDNFVKTLLIFAIEDTVG